MQLGATSTDRMVALTTICFDIAGLELYLPLLVGGTLLLATREQAMDPEELSTAHRRTSGPPSCRCASRQCYARALRTRMAY